MMINLEKIKSILLLEMLFSTIIYFQSTDHSSKAPRSKQTLCYVLLL
jgi:hypothetical protein